MTETLARSRVSLDPIVRNILEQGRTVRSRNRDGEYAIVLTGDRTVVDVKLGECLAGAADDRADWTITVTDFTFRNVAEADPDLRFYAPVFDRSGVRVGTIAVSGSPYGKTITDQGPVETMTVFFSALRSGDLFRESVTDSEGRAVLFRATADAEPNGRVVAETVTFGEERVFDLGPDYLAFKVTA
ncbi:hypothetical protein [Paractinoplanes deccanensis]|nr:hypothetical protein [Actinoplanes deccanensis]